VYSSLIVADVDRFGPLLVTKFKVFKIICFISLFLTSDCVQRKKKVREHMELQLDNGIDKCLTCVIGWMKHILKTDQRKSDFSTDQPPEKQYTIACQNVCIYSLFTYFCVLKILSRALQCRDSVCQTKTLLFKFPSSGNAFHAYDKCFMQSL